MARSTYIYILYDVVGDPVAAFTVKHEAVTFWTNRLVCDPYVEMWRIRDGGRFAEQEQVEGWQDA